VNRFIKLLLAFYVLYVHFVAVLLFLGSWDHPLVGARIVKIHHREHKGKTAHGRESGTEKYYRNQRANGFPLLEAPLEPFHGNPRNLFERTGLLEQVRCAGNDRQIFLRFDDAVCISIEVEYLRIIATYDEQNRSGNPVQKRSGKVGTASAGHYGLDHRPQFRCCLKGCRRAGACSKIAQPETFHFRDAAKARGSLL
jgi:hypothetical protein